jgi:hypothetical protein
MVQDGVNDQHVREVQGDALVGDGWERKAADRLRAADTSPPGLVEDLVSDARGHCGDSLHEARRAVAIVSRAGRSGGVPVEATDCSPMGPLAVQDPKLDFENLAIT